MDSINISTLVMMLETNLRLNSSKLDEIFNAIETLPYDENEEGVVKTSVRGKHKGICKKQVYQKNKTAPKKEKKNFQNQLSFYVRVFEKQEVLNGTRSFDNGIHVWEYKKGQTAFQFKDVYVDDKNAKILSQVNRKSVGDTVIQDGNNKHNGIVYANSIRIESESPIEKVFVNFVIEVNMFVFTSGKVKVAGCTSVDQIQRAMGRLMGTFDKYISDPIGSLGILPYQFTIHNIIPVMINSDFKNSYEIKRYELDKLMQSKYHIISTHEPCTHPAVIVKYYCNEKYDMGDGRCHCREKYGNTYFCKGRDDAEGGCKSVTILVFQSGKVIITGGRILKQVHGAHTFMKKVFEDNKKIIERIQEER